ncbi:hypothetical protein V2S66_34285 [Streptomyces sp. V4-01]|uniref:Uncharacterized protein n=1 Tax=Actinacidiphila polyblastidii TaxID=3110430 RepID=A0ABU7PMF3_9ACTN|nr:hypothetical protein [Streptomyces sp. V4-01]
MHKLVRSIAVSAVAAPVIMLGAAGAASADSTWRSSTGEHSASTQHAVSHSSNEQYDGGNDHGRYEQDRTDHRRNDNDCDNYGGYGYGYGYGGYGLLGGLLGGLL